MSMKADGNWSQSRKNQPYCWYNGCALKERVAMQLRDELAAEFIPMRSFAHLFPNEDVQRRHRGVWPW